MKSNKKDSTIGKRRAWALRYAKIITKQLKSNHSIDDRMLQTRIAAILIEASNTFPPDCIDHNNFFYSPKFGEHIHIDENIFSNLMKDMEEKGFAHWDGECIMFHPPLERAEEKAVELASKLAPGKSSHTLNSMIKSYFFYVNKHGAIKKFNLKKLSDARERIKYS